MAEPSFDRRDDEEWDEYDWERFLQRSEVRAARFQELFETLLNHPDRDEIIAREMGWDKSPNKCPKDQDCSQCDERFDCEIYEMSRLASEAEDIEDDADLQDLVASFEEVKEIPAYRRAEDFAALLEKALQEHVADWENNEDAVNAYMSAHMVAAQIAGGHGIGYERDSLCGNIANCKRAVRNLQSCIEQLADFPTQGELPPAEAARLRAEAEQVGVELDRWIESLRARVWWR